MRVMLIAYNFDVLVGESIDAGDVWIQLQLRQGHWLPAQLEIGLIKVVAVEVSIAKGVDKCAGFKPANLCHHVGEQGIGSDVERNAKKHIG